MEKTTSLAAAENQQPIPYLIEDIKSIMSKDQLDQLLYHIEVSGGWDAMMLKLRKIKDHYHKAILRATAAEIEYIEILNKPEDILMQIEFLDELIFLGQEEYRYEDIVAE